MEWKSDTNIAHVGHRDSCIRLYMIFRLFKADSTLTFQVFTSERERSHVDTGVTGSHLQTDIITSQETHPAAAATFITAGLLQTSNNHRGASTTLTTHPVLVSALIHLTLSHTSRCNCTGCQRSWSSHQQISHIKGIVPLTLFGT